MTISAHPRYRIKTASATRAIAAALLASALGACAAPGLYETARALSPNDDAYAAALHEGYLMLAKAELDEADWRDSKHFSNKALAAAVNGDVPPDRLNERKIKKSKRADLGSARSRLVSAKAGPAGEVATADLANAQVMFDCWMQEHEEGFQKAEIAACRAQFENALSKVGVAVLAYNQAAAQAVLAMPATMTVAPEPEKAPLPGPYVIYFEFDSAKISPNAELLLDIAAREIEAGEPALLVITGHTDRAGGEDYNRDLSERRAGAVAGYLAGQGVDQSQLRLTFMGEGDTAITTGDGVREPGNRRVGVKAFESSRIAENDSPF